MEKGQLPTGGQSLRCHAATDSFSQMVTLTSNKTLLLLTFWNHLSRSAVATGLISKFFLKHVSCKLFYNYESFTTFSTDQQHFQRGMIWLAEPKMRTKPWHVVKNFFHSLIFLTINSVNLTIIKALKGENNFLLFNGRTLLYIVQRLQFLANYGVYLRR